MSPEQLIAVPIQSNDSDERYTPKWIFDGLGLTFDLDPASPVDGGDRVPAARKLTRNDDGLAHDWHGLVWLNPPFSESTRWADKFRQHGDGVFLGPVANARWWFDLVRDADVVWHCRDFPFTHPTHAGRRSSMPLAMIAYGAEAAEAVTRLAGSGVQDGVLMTILQSPNPQPPTPNTTPKDITCPSPSKNPAPPDSPSSSAPPSAKPSSAPSSKPSSATG